MLALVARQKPPAANASPLARSGQKEIMYSKEDMYEMFVAGFALGWRQDENEDLESMFAIAIKAVDSGLTKRAADGLPDEEFAQQVYLLSQKKVSGE